MRIGVRRFSAGSIIIGVLVVALACDAWALPPFARKYKTSCATCHEAYPRLNAVGESFRLNGFKFTDDELYIKEDPVQLGDEAYKRLWPDSVWPSDIPGLPPISLILRSDFEINAGKSPGDVRSQFVFPRESKLIAAGALGESMSMFVELGFNRSGDAHGHAGGDVQDEGTLTTVEGWLQFEDLVGAENLVNLRVGTVGMHEIGLFTSRNHNRLTVNPYLYSSWAMPRSDHHETEEALEDDFGAEASLSGNPFSFTQHAQPGIEINGFGSRWRYAVGVVNGNGDKWGDNNSEKDLYGQFAYKIGGLGFDGSGVETEDGEMPATGAQSWRDDSLTFSLSGYSGTGLIEIAGEDAEWKDDDDFWRLGVGAKWKYGDITFRTGYGWGENDRPYGLLTNQSVTSQSWFAEADYFAYPWLIPYVRYEELALDLPSGVEAIQEDQDRARFIVGSKLLLRANVTLSLEGRFYTENEPFTKTTPRGDRDSENEIVLSLTAAF